VIALAYYLTYGQLDGLLVQEQVILLGSDRICSLDENCNANMVTAFPSYNARYYNVKLDGKFLKSCKTTQQICKAVMKKSFKKAHLVVITRLLYSIGIFMTTLMKKSA
jgi:hypothetical protein